MTGQEPDAPTGQWPLSSSLVLGALPTAPSSARLHARNVVLEWGLGSLADKVELVVSELATNALRVLTFPDGRPRYEAGAGLPILGLRLSSDRLRILVEVWDGSPHLPTPKTTDPDEETGRGLMLVEALCEQWGWGEPSSGSRGKVVWALVAAVE